ncbi:syndecan 1 [Streptomyces sp. DpondAA-D4]|nr:syndecan 1 [Streptomyces sp. DpondAA-D4]
MGFGAWFRREERRVAVPVPPEAPGDSGGPTEVVPGAVGAGGDVRGADWDGGWQRVAPPTVTVARSSIGVSDGLRFRSGLASWQNPAFGGELGHAVLPSAPVGLIHGVARPAAPAPATSRGGPLLLRAVTPEPEAGAGPPAAGPAVPTARMSPPRHARTEAARRGRPTPPVPGRAGDAPEAARDTGRDAGRATVQRTASGQGTRGAEAGQGTRGAEAGRGTRDAIAGRGTQGAIAGRGTASRTPVAPPRTRSEAAAGAGRAAAGAVTGSPEAGQGPRTPDPLPRARPAAVRPHPSRPSLVVARRPVMAVRQVSAVPAAVDRVRAAAPAARPEPAAQDSAPVSGNTRDAPRTSGDTPRDASSSARQRNASSRAPQGDASSPAPQDGPEGDRVLRSATTPQGRTAPGPEAVRPALGAPLRQLPPGATPVAPGDRASAGPGASGRDAAGLPVLQRSMVSGPSASPAPSPAAGASPVPAAREGSARPQPGPSSPAPPAARTGHAGTDTGRPGADKGRTGAEGTASGTSAGPRSPRTPADRSRQHGGIGAPLAALPPTAAPATGSRPPAAARTTPPAGHASAASGPAPLLGAGRPVRRRTGPAPAVDPVTPDGPGTSPASGPSHPGETVAMPVRTPDGPSGTSPPAGAPAAVKRTAQSGPTTLSAAGVRPSSADTLHAGPGPAARPGTAAHRAPGPRTPDTSAPNRRDGSASAAVPGATVAPALGSSLSGPVGAPVPTVVQRSRSLLADRPLSVSTGAGEGFSAPPAPPGTSRPVVTPSWRRDTPPARPAGSPAPQPSPNPGSSSTPPSKTPPKTPPPNRRTAPDERRAPDGRNDPPRAATPPAPARTGLLRRVQRARTTTPPPVTAPAPPAAPGGEPVAGRTGRADARGSAREEGAPSVRRAYGSPAAARTPLPTAASPALAGAAPGGAGSSVPVVRPHPPAPSGGAGARRAGPAAADAGDRRTRPADRCRALDGSRLGSPAPRRPGGHPARTGPVGRGRLPGPRPAASRGVGRRRGGIAGGPPTGGLRRGDQRGSRDRRPRQATGRTGRLGR